ncbi:S8 family peptidase [Allokutzneria multivorans]|uniref:S8 family peptidase n=1 Tax=Allokutzneria multivorans TaxID=1142134 RepID=UPI0031E9A77D
MSSSRVRLSATRSAAAVLAAVLAVGVTAGTAGAQAPITQDPLAKGVPAAKGLSAKSLQQKVEPRLAAANGKVTAFIELDKAPAVDAFAETERKGAGKQQAKAAAQRAKDDTKKAADSVVGQLRSRDGGTRELYRTTNAVPGVVVQADAAKITELASRKDVRSVRTVVPKSRGNSNAVQLTRALQTWKSNGVLGDGVRVGIIDDGIDYTHATFGGPGTKEAYAAIDRDKANPAVFPTPKVVGGIDLVGDKYDATGQNGSMTPVPDPNPISCGTHGTHVAGTTGGFGVNADGTAFKGDHNKLTAKQLNEMRVGPGTAPRSLLYSIKVFGCDGSTDVTSQAMDWALDPDGDGDFTDRLDVVNMSLGSNFGGADDPDSLFVRKLVANGVLPVISAGNGGDLYDVGGSPGNTPEALTVASSRDAFVLRDGAEVAAPNTLVGVKAGQYSQDYAKYDTLDLTKPVVALSAADNKDGCLAYSAADKAAVAGKFAWLEWDDNDATRKCGSAARANQAGAAGALGVVLSSNLEDFAAGIAGNATVPMFQFTGSVTKALRPALTAGTLEVKLGGYLRSSVSTTSPAINDTPSTFTSRSVHSKIVKPDLSAPGDTIASALSGSGNQPLVISGTSMAAPHTSGVTALVRQAHPDWTPEEVKAAVMNTAGIEVRTGPNGTVYAPNRVGTGRIDAKAALDNQVLAMVTDDPGAISASFGAVEVSGPLSLTKNIKVVNKGVKPVEYRTSYQAATTIPGVSYELSAPTVKVGPRGVANFKVTLKITDPAALRKTVDSTVATTQLGVARQFLADASGRIVLTPSNGAVVPLRLSVYAAPKPAADILAKDTLLFQPGQEQGVLNLTGRGVNQGTGPQAYRSLVSVLEMQARSDQLPDCGGSVTRNCTINETAKAGDLRYVGVGSTAPLAKMQGKPQDGVLAFGLVSWGNWANLGSNTQPFVSIDTTNDGRPEFETFATKLTGSDVWVATTVDLRKPLPTGGFTTVDIQPINGQFGDVDTNAFDSNVVVLPVTLKALGVNGESPSAKLTYRVGVAGYYRAPGDTTGTIDQIATPLTFDPLNPGLWVQGAGEPALSHLAQPGTALVVNRDAAAQAADKSEGLLLLHHHNATGKRAQVVGVKDVKLGGAAPIGRPGGPQRR